MDDIYHLLHPAGIIRVTVKVETKGRPPGAPCLNRSLTGDQPGKENGRWRKRPESRDGEDADRNTRQTLARITSPMRRRPASRIVRPAVQPASRIVRPAVQPVSRVVRPASRVIRPAAWPARTMVRPTASPDGRPAARPAAPQASPALRPW